jgi:hypothetical protein
LSQPGGDVVAEGCVNHRLDHFRRRIGFANPFQAVVRADADQNRVLAAGGFSFNLRNANDLADNLSDFHDRSR